MIVHVFALHWRDQANIDQKHRAITEISAFSGAIPGLLEVHVGENISPQSPAYETVGVMKFASADALAAYNTHPVHTALLDWLLPLVDPVEFDFHSN